MEESEYLAMEVPARLVAKALEAPGSTVYLWLKNGEIPARQTITGRWLVTVKACHDLIEARSRKVDKEEIRRRFDAEVQQYLATRKAQPACA